MPYIYASCIWIDITPFNLYSKFVAPKIKCSKITMTNVYAPTEEAEDESVESFYDTLHRECERVPKHDLLVILGDFNARIGREEQ